MRGRFFFAFGLPIISLICLVACTTSALPDLTPTPLIIQPTTIPTISTTPNLVPTGALTSTPTSPPIKPETIEPENIAGLATVMKRQFADHQLIFALAWSPNGKLLAASAGEQVHLLQAETLKDTTVVNTNAWVQSLAFDPQGKWLATADRGGRLGLWQVANGQSVSSVFPLQAHRKGANAAVFSPDDRYVATGGNDGMVRLWQIPDGKRANQYIGGAWGIPALAFVGQEQTLAIANSKVVRLRDIISTRFVHTLRSPQPLYSLASSPDGNLMAAGDQANSVIVWDVASEEVICSLSNGRSAPGNLSGLVWKVAFSPDGQLLASGSANGDIHVWQIPGCNLLMVIKGHERAVTSLAFSPDGSCLASGGLDATIKLWAITP